MAAIGTPAVAERQYAQWSKTTVRIVFGIIWLIDATLKWLPGFRTAYANGFHEGADGQPNWLNGWFNFWINLEERRATGRRSSVPPYRERLGRARVRQFASRSADPR
jgi:hypothetical protein